MNLQFRIRPLESLLDVDPPRIQEALYTLPTVRSVQIFDDRRSDATFVTLVLDLSKPDLVALGELRQTLLDLPRARVVLIDSTGRETDLRDVPPAGFLRFSEP